MLIYECVYAAYDIHGVYVYTCHIIIHTKYTTLYYCTILSYIIVLFLLYTTNEYIYVYSTCIYGPPDDTPAGRGAFFSGSQGGRYNIG